MKAILLLLAAYALVGWNDAQAACVKATADGWVDCQTGKPAAEPKPPVKDGACVQAVIAASEAYRMVVYDAGNPSVPALLDAVDFRLSQQPFPASREHAGKALSYIVLRLRDAGLRAYQEWQVDWAAEEYIKKECYK